MNTLLVGNQILWFGNQMDHLLINLNQIHEYGIPMYNDLFSQSQFGIDCNDDYILFNSTRMIVYFKIHVPTDWETHNLPIIMLTSEDWDLVNVDLVLDKAGNKQNVNNLVFGNWSAKTEYGGNEASQNGLSSQTMGKSQM
jgi:hypothetical protein